MYPAHTRNRQRCASRRRCLGDNNFSRIGQSVQDRLLRITSAKRVYRTDGYALSTIRTVLPAISRSKAVDTAALNPRFTAGVNCLYRITHGLTAAAHDTFVHVPHNGRERSIVNVDISPLYRISRIPKSCAIFCNSQCPLLLHVRHSAG